MQDNASLPSLNGAFLLPSPKCSAELLRHENNEGTLHTPEEIYCCDNNFTCSTCTDRFAPSSKSPLVVSVSSFGFLLFSEHSLSRCSPLLFLETCTCCCSCWCCVTDPISSMWYVQSCIQIYLKTVIKTRNTERLPHLIVTEITCTISPLNCTTRGPITN